MTEDRRQVRATPNMASAVAGTDNRHSGHPALALTHSKAPGACFRSRHSKGFTLIELLVVMAIMGILVTIAQPSLNRAIIKAKEAVLKENLFQMREAIDQYYADNAKYPDALGDMVNTEEPSRSYLRSIPRDPFTGSDDWITVAPVDEEGGVFDVHSASPLLALDGTQYNVW